MYPGAPVVDPDGFTYNSGFREIMNRGTATMTACPRLLGASRYQFREW